MKLIILLFTTLLCLSCSQKDIVADYERRIASVYSYSLSKINSRSAAPFISNEFSLNKSCNIKLGDEKVNCISEYYESLLLDFDTKNEQLLTLVDTLRADVEQYRRILNELNQKIIQLKNKKITANQNYYQKLIKSLEKDYSYYLASANIFEDHLNSLPEQFAKQHSAALSRIEYIINSDKNLQKEMFFELEESLHIDKRRKKPTHPVITYRNFINQLHYILDKEISDAEKSREYSNTAYHRTFDAGPLLSRIPLENINADIYKRFSVQDYNKIIQSIWRSINNILLKNKPFTHLTLLNYNGLTNKFVSFIPTGNFCKNLKKISFNPINIPWSEGYLNLFYKTDGPLTNGITCRHFKVDNIAFLDFGKNVGAKYVPNSKRIDVIYEYRGREKDFIRTRPKIYSPVPKMITDEITNALNLN